MLAILITLLLSTLVSSEHSGAYSSPQYAKKMFPKQLNSIHLLPREKAPVSFRSDYDGARSSIDRFDSSNDTSDYGRSSILESAGSFLSGAGGQMVTSMAKDLIARSTGSSQVGSDCILQVLSLNLTNLVILIVLKALILAAGFFGAGAWKGGHYGRSLDNNTNASYITEDEILLYLSYLTGQQDRDYGCLYRLSCQKPEQAKLYSSGAEILLTGARLVNGMSPDLQDYEEIYNGIQDAVAWGQNNNSCDAKYKCGS